MDLLEAEALNDLIHAETRGQQKQAMQQMAGAHKKLYQRWRTDLVQCVAHVNAFIDYGDNDGIEEEDVMHPTRAKVRFILREMRQHLADGRRGESIRSGLRCTLVGPPNAGKSSLLNVLAGRAAAIVSPVPGTTRDIVQVDDT
jgi:tRNA U34 5-carboxymethylaminomethyl modifying GTPase MnmE/TrmE